MLQVIPFNDVLSVSKTSSAFSGYARSYKIEIVDNKDPLLQLEASKSSIKDLFRYLLIEFTSFKYQITLTFY